MKKIYLISLFLLTYSGLFSQDLIVTQKGDSIFCTISKENRDFVYFSYFDTDNIQKNSLLIREKIFSITKNYATLHPETYPTPPVKNIEYDQFRIGIYGGFSYLLAPLAQGIGQDLENHLNALKTGYHFGANAEFYFSEYLGIGLKLCRFRTKNQSNDILFPDNKGGFYKGFLREDIYTTFLGPSFSTRIYNMKKTNSFSANIAVGYVGYVDNVISIYPTLIKAKTAGIVIEFDYDIGLSNSFSLGMMMSILLSNFNTFEVTQGNFTQSITLEEGQYEGLNRLDLGLVLRFNR